MRGTVVKLATLCKLGATLRFARSHPKECWTLGAGRPGGTVCPPWQIVKLLILNMQPAAASNVIKHSSPCQQPTLAALPPQSLMQSQPDCSCQSCHGD